jgi:hypothetical protein
MSAELQQQMTLDRTKKDKSPSSPKQKPILQKTKSNLSANGTPSLDESTVSKHSPHFKGFHTISTISKAVCMCSTALNKKQPFLFINELASQGNLNVCLEL